MLVKVEEDITIGRLDNTLPYIYKSPYKVVIRLIIRLSC